MASVDLPQDKPITESRQQRRARRQAITQTYWAREHSLANSESSVPITVRQQILRQHGDFSLAYSTHVQPLLQHLGNKEGYLAYRNRLGISCALGDPLANPDQQESLINRFIQEHPRPVFCQISLPTATQLSKLGFYVNEMGVDTTLDLAQYSFAGKQKEWLRYAFNWTSRRGYSVVESDFDHPNISVDQIESISESWRKTRTVKRKEVRFLNRPIVLAPEPDVRRFFLLDSAQQVQAYVFFDPLYRDGKVIGYVTSIKRRHPDAPQYAEHAIMKAAIEQLKSEGVKEIKLGLSPAAFIKDNTFKHSWLISKTFRTLFQSRLINRRAYNLSGHANYKRRFRGTEEKTYYASRSRFSPRQLAALVGLCGIA